jgi:phosphate transport system protein
MGREQYQLELQELKNQMTSVVELVKKNIRDSIKFLGSRDMKGAGLVIESDEQVNHKCWDIEEHCIRLIATQQPVAGDLRFIFSVLQITNEVERIGDYAKGIARISRKIGSEPLIKPLVDIPRMGDIATGMLEDALRAFTEGDDKAARDIPTRDIQIDILYRQVHRELLTFVMERPTNMEQAMLLDWVAHNLERVGDRVINICERVIFTVTGEVVDFN